MNHFIIFLFLFCNTSFAQEKLGDLYIEELLVKSEFNFQEPKKGQFLFEESSFYIKWVNDNISARLALGDTALLNRPQIYNASTESGLGMIEGFVALKKRWGTLEMGLQPVRFGSSGDVRESQLYLTRSYVYTEKLMSLRDLGFRFSTDHNGYYTTFFAHNGEAYKDLDNQMWFTWEWGWVNEGNLRVGFAAQTGHPNANATSSSTSTLLSFDPSKSSKWRIGQIFAHWTPNDWDVTLEATHLELDQNKETKELATGLMAIGVQDTQHIRYDFRYQFIDPNRDVSDDLKSSLDLAVSYQSPWGNSRFSFVFTQNIEEKDETSNNIYRLVWQMTPLVKSQ